MTIRVTPVRTAHPTSAVAAPISRRVRHAHHNGLERNA